MCANTASIEPFTFRATNRMAELVHQYPAAVAIIHECGLDVSTVIHLTIAQAAASGGLKIEALIERLALELPSTPPVDEDVDCSALAIDELIQHIETFHHDYTRRELARLNFLVERCQLHVTDDSFNELSSVVKLVTEHIMQHMVEEEEHLFPIGRALDRPQPIRPIEHEDCERQLIKVEHNHDDILHTLEQLRASCAAAPWTPDDHKHQRAIINVIENLANDLSVHSATEEEFLIPAIAYADELYEQRARHRHRGAGHE